LSYFAANPIKAYCNAIKHAMAYIKKTIKYGITYHHRVSLQPVGFVNSDHANDKDTQRSTNGHIFFVGGGPVSWSTKRQEMVAMSITEAEYVAVSRAVQQVMWLSFFFDKVSLPQKKLVTLFINNNSAIEITKMY